ncbi:hypothetical protein QFZ81_002913 [Paenibacillus sp. V4I9]|uniref:hypothetical protein n=1 Tax=Paenibacillus sp. V4I9 TaxID=3042308 RepID=UPI00278A8A62|nr:hypothetical protein [Paenibacillus sp. V4I9]MDQ0887825.1 hypothetical protein [Paenibacillus sp. V4I9]
MFDWIEEFKPTNKDLKQIHHRRFNLKKVSFESPATMTELARLLSAGSVLLADNMMNIYSAKDETARSLIMNDIAPHFEDVKIVYVEDEIDVVNMQYLKKDSKKMFNSTNIGIIQVIHDLIRTNDMCIWTDGKKRELTRYSVRLNALNKYDIDNTNDIQDFFTKGYFDLGEEFGFIPTGWILVDDLKESKTLRFFATFVPCITLVVDESNKQVVMLQLSGDSGMNRQMKE